MAFFQELKRRRVVRAASVYLAAVWVVAQVVGEVVAPAIGLGDTAVRWVAILAALGFPVVLILAWAFDLSPDTSPEGDDGLSPTDSWLSARVAVAVVILLLAGAALGWIARPAPSADAADDRSLAVLPFQSLTGDGDRYLSDGLTEDVVVALQKAGAFEIIGRASTERYRGQAVTPAEVAGELGVRYVLTGSVRRGGDMLRVAVQLTDGSTNRDLWADHYDQELTVDNVFAMYTDVAESVARSLEAELDAGAEALLSERPTTSVVAYQLYMRGRSAWARRLPELMGRAIEYFDRALDADPSYARAHAGRADALILQGFYLPGEQGKVALVEAQAAARRALALEPTLAEAHTSLAYSLWLGAWDWEGAEEEFRRALDLDPDYPTAHHWLGDVLAQQLRTEEALTHLDRALRLDPYAPAFHFDRGKALYWAGRFAESLDNFESALEIEPSYLGVTYGLHGQALIGSGREADGVEMLARGVEFTLGAEKASQVRARYGEGGLEAVNRLFLADQLSEPAELLDPFFLGGSYVDLQRFEEALDAYTEGVDQGSLFSLTLYADPFARAAFWGDTRYESLVRRIGLDPSKLTGGPTVRSVR